jgi:hypothetical protein
MARRHIRIVLLLAWPLLLAGLALSRAAGPSLRPEAATPFTVSGITYILDRADPRATARVVFTLSPGPSAARGAIVRAKLLSASSNYATCVNIPAGSSRWECPVAGAIVAAADQLRVEVVEPPAVPKYGVRLPLVTR